MKWTKLNDIREKYLSFFESKQHLRLPSFSLVPQNDHSLLLINSGMAPMKKYFTGEITPPSKRITTCQKCVRTPDIERVGITARHGTFFEMLGNFSFGDYFKVDATKWAWEFCVEVMELPIDRLWVSIYENDDESFDIWTREVGVDPKKIVRLGKADNFWEHGAGPCGPCSEIYFDRGEEYGCDSPACAVGCDCDRYVEFWNLVFTQFNSDANNNYTPLANPNIDTGMGLERLACIIQGVDNLFLVDSVKKILDHVCRVANISYGQDKNHDISIRVITDHIRSTTFMISDGILPSNEGRGYVLRRLIRRAARHGRLLGVHEHFLSDICDTVIQENHEAYPALKEKETFIKKIMQVEESSFSKTIDQGLNILNDIIQQTNGKVISGEDAFKLNDTYGFPIDLTKEIIAEKGMEVDETKFKELMKQQKDRARQAHQNAGSEAWSNNEIDLNYINETDFLGYESTSTSAKIIEIIKNGKHSDYAAQDEKVIIILDQTTFYAHGGGQIGDTGYITTNQAKIKIEDTTKTSSSIYLHKGYVVEGIVSCNDQAKVEVNKKKRLDIMRNHTAAHLLQAALRKVLGDHVEQSGQLVDENRVRFDFTHFSALTQQEINKVEEIINDKIFNEYKVSSQEMPIDEAKKLGAMALFGEKYGKMVRVVQIEDFSLEFCGGTHVNDCSKLSMFKILSESSVASGVRRIEAITGKACFNLMNKSIQTIKDCSNLLKINNSEDLLKTCSQIITNSKEKDKTIEKLNSKISLLKVSELIAASKIHGETKIICSYLKNTDASSLSLICDMVKDKLDDFILALACSDDQKGNIAVAVGQKTLKKGAHAGKIVKAIAALADGNGGGKPDRAMAGVKNINKLADAISQSESIILKHLNN